MPFKHNADRRHRISKMKFKVTNWSEYEAGLRQRGSLTLWMHRNGQREVVSRAIPIWRLRPP